MTSTIPLPSTVGQFMTTTETGTFSIAKNSTASFNVTGNNPGWYPLAITYFGAGWNQLCYYGMYPTSITSGSIIIQGKARNLSTTTDSGSRTVEFHVLWVKE